MSEKPPKFKKTTKQIEAVKLLGSPAKEIMFYGGSRSGKTFILVRALIIRALKCSGSRHVILRRFFNDIKQSVWMDTMPKVINLCFPELKGRYRPNNTDFFHPFPNGSELWIAGLDDKDRAEKILGKEHSTMFFNECSQIDIGSIETAKTRLAQKNELINKLYYDMNPPSKKHWSYPQFILKKNPEDGLSFANPDRYAHLLMNPMDNLENLDDDYMEILDNLPESKKKRFRDGLFTDEVQGQVFNTATIKRIDKLPADLDRIIVGHDPAVTSKVTSDEHGIVICARKGDIGYVVRDASGIYTPAVAAQKSVFHFHDLDCDKIVSEVNNGGDYIETVLRAVDKNISYKSVRASRGKVKRAEPVANLYEQGRIYHVGHLPELEGEMGDFMIDEKEMSYSPNRADAMIWAMHELFNLNQGEARVRMLG